MTTNSHGSLSSYAVGFMLSLIFTFAPYFMVTQHIGQGWVLGLALAIFAISQVLVQLVFFLHLGREKRPRWHSLAFGFMTVVVVIVVFGSLWIMNNLNYHTMSGPSVDQYIQDEEAIKP